MKYGDCHMHIFMDGYDYKAAVARYQNGLDEADIRTHLQIYQDMGITYLRDGGDHYGASVRARELAPEYGIEYRTPIHAIHKNGYYGGIVGHGFDTIEEYAGLVRHVSEEKGDFIKIMASGILDFDEYGRVTTPLQDEQLIHEMVHIAHDQGFAVMVHVNTPRQILYAVEAGCDTVEHGYYMDESCMDRFVETGAIWVPTIATCGCLRGSGRFNEAAVQRITESHKANVRKALEKGVLIGPGSDAGAYRVPHGEGLVSELAILKEACQGRPDLLAKLEPTLDKAYAIIQKKFKRD